MVLALLLLRAQKFSAIKNAVATVFEPASEHGQKGMDELHEQTVNLLSFQQLPKNIFDTQVAFNMVSRYGETRQPASGQVEQRILKHYQRISGGTAPLPSLLLVQAPIFHGYAFAIHLRMEQIVDVEQFSQALSGEHVNIAQPAEDAPSNVSVAGQGNILLSVKPDPNDRQWSLAVGGGGQFANRCNHCGGMCGNHGGDASARQDPMKVVGWLVLLAVRVIGLRIPHRRTRHDHPVERSDDCHSRIRQSNSNL